MNQYELIQFLEWLDKRTFWKEDNDVTNEQVVREYLMLPNTDVEFIAFRTVDRENDIWCEEVFLFPDRDCVRRFFTRDNETLKHFFTDPFVGDSIEDFKIFDDNPAKNITAVTFRTESHGIVELVEMSKGYVIQSA